MSFRSSVSLAVISAALVGSAACGASTAISGGAPATTQVDLDNEFELAPGQAASLAGLGLTVRFDSVGNDSRCPQNVQCVWAGNAAVFVSFKRGGSPAYQTQLNSMVSPKSVKDGNETISLTNVRPETDTRHPIAKNEYRARFLVTSGS